MSVQIPSSLRLQTLSCCPLCGRGAAKHLYDLNPIQVHRCAACRMVYLNPCLDAMSMAASYQNDAQLLGLNDFYEGYSSYGNLNAKTVTMREFDRCLDALGRHAPEGGGKRLFEIGCGNGFFLAAARRRGWQVGGVEASRDNVREAKEKFGLELQAGLFEEHRADAGTWDAVAMRDVLEHRFDPHAFLDKALALLRKGGLLLIAVPNHASALRDISAAAYAISGRRLQTGLRKLYLMEHTAYYDRRTLGMLFEMRGLRSLEFFQSSTDLQRYALSAREKAMAGFVLGVGKLMRRENRLIGIARKA